MKVFFAPEKLPYKNIVLILGMFDGVHLGHQKVIQLAVKYAKKYNLRSVLLTFDPHPQTIVHTSRHLKLLTTLDERLSFLEQLNLDAVLVLRFTHQIASLSSKDFIEKILIKKLSIKRIFAGYDFAFGKERSGHISILKQESKKIGFGVSIISAKSYKGDHVKSSKIREILETRDFNFGIKLLGHPYRFIAKVEKGHGIGKRLGFPTANLQLLKNKLIPSAGVYIARVKEPGSRGQEYRAAVNIGERPTFKIGGCNVEAHLINFSGNLIGKTIQVDLIKKIRPEIHFSYIHKLQAQISKDIRLVEKSSIFL